MLRSRTDDWFECKIKYQKQQEDGTQKKATELYTVDALSFTEAESKITEEMKLYVSGETFIKAITRAPYKEIYTAGVVELNRPRAEMAKAAVDKYFRAFVKVSVMPKIEEIINKLK